MIATISMAAPKLADIAKRAGVSIAAVSIALNEKNKHKTTHVSPGTREFIRKIAVELGYSPNRVAKALAQPGTHLLGVVVPTRDPIFFDPFMAQTISGIQAMVMRRGYDLLISSPSGRGGRNTRDQILNSRFTDGVIFITPPYSSTRTIDAAIQDLQAAQISFTMVSSYYGRAPINYVGVNDMAIGETAVRYLVKCGHTRIAFLSSSATAPTHSRILEGCKRGLQDAGLQLRADDVGFSGHNPAQVFSILDSWLARGHERPTAIFAADESLLLYTYDYLQHRKIRIPEEIAIITRANSASVEGLRPRPTAILVPAFEMGELATNILIDSIRQPNTPPRQLLLPFRLAEGHTT